VGEQTRLAKDIAKDMGKKSKHKKQKQAQRVQQPVATRQPEVTLSVSSAPVMQRAAGLELGERYNRGDIMRIFILLLIVALVLIALVIVDQRSSIVVQAGQKLATFLRL
jgi:hypothetical protein